MNKISLTAIVSVMAVMLAIQQDGLWSHNRIHVFAGPPPSKRPALQPINSNQPQQSVTPTRTGQITPSRPTVTTSNSVNTRSPATAGGAGSRKRANTCNVILNELFVGDSIRNDPQFVEIKRYCPSGIPQPKLNLLNGYYLMGFSLANSPILHAFVDLKNERLEDITETINGQTVTNQLYTLGSPREPLVSGLKLGTVPLSNSVVFQYSKYPSATTAFPSEDDALNVVALAYVPDNRRVAFRQAFSLPKTIQRADHKIDNLQLPQPKLNEMKGRIVDYIIYGKDFSDKAEDLMRQILSDENFVLQNHLQTMRPSMNLLKSITAYTRCNPEETQAAAYQFQAPSAMRENVCTTPKPKHVLFKPHDFKGVEKYLVLNLIESLKHAGTSTEMFLGNPIQVAANLLGLHFTTVKKFVMQAQTCDVRPDQQRNRKKYVKELIDSFDRDAIRHFISDCYRRGIAPLFKEIYKTFLAYKNDECSYTTSSRMTGVQQFLPLCTNMHGETQPTPEPVVVHHTIKPDEFKCSSTTFSQVLHEMGFYYGKIDNRIALLQREDLVLLRGRYITRYIRNEKSANRFNVTFLDETWVDPHTKYGHGWQLRRPANVAEQLRYTFKNIKISSGPRLIVLAAGDEHGIIKESVKVRRIDAANVANDYHKNVNHQEFIEWFRELLDYYDAKKEKHIIVMDNAPYHSTQVAPKQKERKAVLEAWLNKLRQDRTLQVQVPNTAGLRKWELWEEVSKLKNNPLLQDEVYEIDKLAKARGHQVMRLPPYHCMFNPIEFSWNDVKKEVAKLNADQSIETVARLVREALINYDANKWKRHVQHTRNLLDKYWEQDGFMDNENVTKLIIPLDQFEDEDDVEDACASDDAEICEPWYDFDPIEAEKDLAAGRDEVAAWMASLPPPPTYAARGKRKYYCGSDFS